MKNVNKILVLGSCGVGKSTFSKRLQKKLKLPLIHLDQYYWKPNWVKTESEEWRQKVKDLVKRDSWIMDGNHRNTLDVRIPATEAIIFLDFYRWICFWRIWKRRFKGNRASEIPGCKDRVSFELMSRVLWKFPQNRKKFVEQLNGAKVDKKVFVLKSNKEIETFLDSVAKNFNSDIIC